MYYTKYRPEKFSEIIKPNLEIETIQNQIIKGNLGHAYILSGSRGIGKTSTARLIAKAVNCLNFKGDICNECANCLAIKSGSFVDVIEIDAASNRGIDEARSLRESLKFAPLRGNKKVYIIDEVHMLTGEAFNALLKSIEEPPVYVIFILCTTEFHKIPDTIKSRCQAFILKRPSNEQIVEKLEKIVNKEGISVSKDRLIEIAVSSNGGFRDAETMLTQVQNNPDYISSFDSLDSKLDFLEASLSGNYNFLIEYISNLEKNGVNIVNWLSNYLGVVRSVLHEKLGVRKDSILFNENLIQKVNILNSKHEFGEYIFNLNTFIEIYSKIRYSQTPELVFEVLVLSTFEDFKPIKKIIYSNKNITKNNKVAGDVQNNYPSQKSELNPKNDEVFTADLAETELENSEEEVEIIENEENYRSVGVVSIDEISQKWSEVVKSAAEENKTLVTLLKVIRPININNDIITLEVDFKFHAERLDNNKNKLVIEKILYSVFGAKLFYKCVIQNKRTVNGFNVEGEVPNLTDYNVSPPKGLSADDVLSIFDGGVPIK